jgi:hypothetical protein
MLSPVPRLSPIAGVSVVWLNTRDAPWWVFVRFWVSLCWAPDLFCRRDIRWWVLGKQLSPAAWSRHQLSVAIRALAQHSCATRTKRALKGANESSSLIRRQPLLAAFTLPLHL